MTITLDTLYSCLSETFAVTAEQDTENSLTIILQHGEYRTALTLELFTYHIVDDPDPRYGVKLWGTFIDSDDQPFNLRHYSDAEIGMICHTLGDEIVWCRLRPLAVDDTFATIELYRAIHLPAVDQEELASLLQEAINDVLCEWLVLYPVLQAVTHDQLRDLSHLGTLLNHTGQAQ